MSSQPEQGALPVVLGETTFTVFNRLPTELRLMIWEEFVRTPRIICIGEMGWVEVMVVDRRFSIEIDGRTREQTCPLLRVNRESRCVALREPLLLFSLQYPLNTDPFTRRSTQNDRGTGVRHFGIRSCDVLFIHGDFNYALYEMTVEGDTDKIANVIFNIDAKPILRSFDLTFTDPPEWDWVISLGLRLLRTFRNEQYLKNMYCLMRNEDREDSKEERKLPPLELNDLRDLVPSQFRLFERQFAWWLRRFHELPKSLDEWRRYPERREDISKVLRRWKNVTLDYGKGHR
ncbi:hypothetical protein F4680DRAFT_434597 [Xylaria scruposa]|nr:hypothetical protein F4680DRAFT_434597 [Xylaria scruposa]